MGWLKRKKNKWKKKLMDASLKKALAAYIVLGAAGTFLTIMILQFICQSVDNVIWGKYASEYAVSNLSPYYYVMWESMAQGDRVVIQILDFVESWSPVLCIIAGVALVSVLYYRDKLKTPLQILTDSAARIGCSDLNFQCEYHSEDEMGKLCGSFEKMRKNLLENHQKMWNMMEEQKRLNHAFAHDLRTPLTVLHGYIDLLLKYHPQGNISEEKLLETLSMMDKQVIRLKRFGDTMQSVGTLEERMVEKKPVTGADITGDMKEMTAALDGSGGVHIWMDSRMPQTKELYLDEAIVCEVAENILSNSLRYAKEWVQVVLEEVGGFLEIYVQDDGPGFSEEGLKMAAKPYYKDKEEESQEHFGIGLYICYVLCEKHGGSLAIHNSVNGGAIISASFQVRPEEEEIR